MASNLSVIFQDEDILVIDKPPNLVVTKSETNNELTLEDLLKDQYDRLDYHTKNTPDRMGIVHRIDKDTSGLLVIAKTQKALENLQSQFKGRQVKKEYLALVHGLVEESGKVEGGIGRNPHKREKFTVLLEGKEAVTEYEPLERLQLTAGPRRGGLQEIFSDFNKIQMRKLGKMDYGKFTLLSCKPLTGRTHQIRVHLKHIGHPVVSDEKYAGRKMYRLDKRWCPRQFLHAKRLGFYHPRSEEWMEFESELPEDLKGALEKLDVRGWKIEKEVRN